MGGTVAVVHAAFPSFLYAIPTALPRFSPAAFGYATCAAGVAVRGVLMGLDRVGHGLVVTVGMTHAMIVLDQLSLGWRGRVAVREVSGVFAPGSLTAVVGPNGAGKSTLLKGMLGLVTPLRGSVMLADDLHGHVAALPQTNELDRAFPVSVYDLVAMGRWRYSGAWRGLNDADHARIEQALEQVGLSELRARMIGTLSGGQLQRALFARLMLHDARLLMLDEPFAAVDQHTTEALMQLLCRWHTQGCTIVVVLHDLELAHKYFPQTLLLARQVVGWGPTAEVLTPENLHRARYLCAGEHA